MQVVRFNPILCCSILRNEPHFFVSPSAIPVNRYLTECDFIRKTPPSPDKLFKMNNLSVKPHLSPDKVVQNTTCPWKTTVSRTNCISGVNGFRNWWPGPHNRGNPKPGEFTFLPKWNMPNYSSPAYPAAQHLSSK